jgi:hypothetical protein
MGFVRAANHFADAITGSDSARSTVRLARAAGQATTVVAQWASTYGDAGYWVCWNTTPNDACDVALRRGSGPP